MDAVVSKAGYGTLTECIANSVPLIYLPRHGFVEHEALVLGMKPGAAGWKSLKRLSLPESGADALSVAIAAQPDPNVYPTNGAEVIAKTSWRIIADEPAKDRHVYPARAARMSARAAYYLRQRGLTWDEVDIEADDDAKRQVIAWTGREVTPTLWIGDTMLVEPDADEIDAALRQSLRDMLY